MAGNLTENFHELCRLCASKFNLILGINIFEAEGSAREINKKISTCLPIQVHEADRLPKMICAECVYKLETFFTFREKSIETENLFIALVKNNNKINNKVKDHKNAEQTMDIVTTINDQLIVPNHQELLNHPNISLPHIADRENIIVNQEIILNPHDNIVIHNHELENIEIAPNELNSHNMSHETIHNQQLLHHDTTIGMVHQDDMQITETHLNVQNLGLIHSNHALIAESYEQIQEKDINSETCIEGTVLALNNRNDSISVVKVEDVDIKCETQNDMDPLKTNYSEGSDTDETSDGDSDNGENLRNDLLIESNIYNEQNHILLSASEIGTSESNEAMGYYCSVCGSTISDKDDYLDHYSEHLNRCLFCQTDFENLESLKAHKKQMHSRKTPNRNLQSDKIQTRTRHKQERKDKIDENFFKEESSDDDNSIKGENSSEFMNDNDDDDDADNENHKNGKRKRWEPKVCKECGKSYKTNYKLAEHMRKHTGETPYKCTMCDKAFRSKIGLAQHEAKHTGQYDYSCPTCGKGFQCKSYLIVHQRVHSTLKPYPCATCGRNFKTKQSLLDHENRHLGVKPYMCDICGRGFITKGLCKSHQKVHSGRDNRQFPCSVCNKLFVSKSYLNTHVKIHTGEKPFICEVCGKGFLTRVDLKIHSTMHTGEKSFVCEICGKAFARRDALRCHRRSHTGERPYRCDICGQTFTQFSPMAIHKRLHTGERPYSCDVCRKTFVSRSTMMSHKKKHNQNETESNIVSS